MPSGITLKQALLLARNCCTAPACPYDRIHCPLYWHKVFVLHFNREPADNEDPAWDELFKIGYAAYRDLESQQQHIKTAS